MQFTSTLTILLAPLAVAAATATSPATGRTSNARVVTKEGINVISDAKCIYPFSKGTFDATKFAGPTPEDKKQWYTWASTDSSFQAGCRCDSAAYGTFTNGSIALNNSCIRKGTSISVSGYADPVEDFAAGSYKAVVGPAPAASDCSGPNFLIQKIYFNKPGEPKVTEGEGAYETVIVGSSNFDHFWLISQTRHVKHAIIDDYLKDVWALGTNTTVPWSYTKQAHCGSLRM